MQPIARPGDVAIERPDELEDAPTSPILQSRLVRFGSWL